MANLLQLINKSTLIDNKAKSIVEDTLIDLKRNKYYSRTYVLNQIYIVLSEFYSKIDKPLLTIRKAEVYPISKDYNDMIIEIDKDFNILSFENKNISTILDNASNQINLDMNFINNLISNTNSRYNKTVENISFNSVFKEDFISSDYFDKEACELLPCFINCNLNYISIQPKESIGLNDKCSIRLLQGSNGYNGNTHECIVQDDKISFLGELGLKCNLASIIDNNNETWFEYELFKIDNTTKKYCVNLGFNYEEGVKWVRDDKELILSLEIKFDELQNMNMISLSPYLISNKSYIPTIIKEIFITDDKGHNVILGEYEVFDRNKAYAFSKQEVKRIVISFIQSYTYPCTIGHFYYEQTDNDLYFSNYRVGYRIDGNMPSVQNIGIIYNEKEQNFSFPTIRCTDTIDEIKIRNNLYNLNANLEYLNADRFAIGIRDISMNYFIFKDAGEYVSNPYKSNMKITSIYLDANDMIPELFKEVNEDFVKYYISIDNCVTWHSIIPRNHSKKEGFTYYLINSNTHKDFRDENIGYIDTTEDVFGVRVKIVLSRPIDMEEYSPIVYNYTLYIN